MGHNSLCAHITIAHVLQRDAHLWLAIHLCENSNFNSTFGYKFSTNMAT